MFSLPILWCSQSQDQAIYQIWKLPKKNSIYLATQWNFSLKNGDFGIFSTFEIWWIWEKFFMNILHIRVFSPDFFHKKIGELFPQNGKISWICTRETNFPKIFLIIFLKWPIFFGKEDFLKGRNHIFQVETRWKFASKIIIATELVCIFTNSFLYSYKSQYPHFRSNSVTMYWH